MTPSRTGAGRRTWKGVPLDERQAERRTALVAAGLDLLGTEGTAGTTVRAVCQRARLNPRYFYESFEDLDDLMVAVFDRVSAEVHAAVIAAGTAVADDPASAVRAALTTLVETITADPRLARVLYIEGVGNEALARRRFTVMQEMADHLAREMGARQGVAQNTDSIAVVAANLGMGGLAELLVAWLNGRIDVTHEQLVEDATHLLVGLGETTDRVALERQGRRRRRAGGRTPRPEVPR